VGQGLCVRRGRGRLNRARPSLAVLETGRPAGGLLPADDRPELQLGPAHGNPGCLPLRAGAASAARLCGRSRAGLAQRRPRGRGCLAGHHARARAGLGGRARWRPAAAGQRRPDRRPGPAPDPPAWRRLAHEPANHRPALVAPAVPRRAGAGHAGDRAAGALQPGSVPVVLAHRHQRHHSRAVYPAAVRRPVPHADRAAQSIA